jgi:hypothetical protein
MRTRTIRRFVLEAFGAMLLLVVAGRGSLGQAAEFMCSGGNVACLVAAIRSANGLAEPSIISLAEGTYTLTAVDNDTDGPNGLPSVTQTLMIQGTDAQSTIIERMANAPNFRLMHVAPTGALTLQRLTMRRGIAPPTATFTVARGGGILNNGGTVIVHHSRLTGNGARGVRGGGMFNNGGVMILIGSTLAENIASGADPFASAYGAGLATNGGSVTISDSTIVDNQITHIGAGAVADVPGSLIDARPAFVQIVNSTIARNVGGGVAAALGQWTIVNSTIAGNDIPLCFACGAAGISAGGAVSIQNTIIAENRSVDCSGPITSLDHNLIRDPTGCTIALQPHDLTGTPGLGIYTDDGTPGRGHRPLLATSPAIDAGDPAACPPTDQLDRSRRGVCDIGAVEFSPDPDPLATFVTGFYRYVLGREPSPTEVAGWVSFLQADPTLDGARIVTHAFFDGPEHRAQKVIGGSSLGFEQRKVTALYRAILGREPEPPAMFGWQELVGARLGGIIRLFLSSSEFQSLVPGCEDKEAIHALETRLWQAALGRPPGTFVQNCGIFDFVGFVVSPPEYLSVPKSFAEHVVILYRGLLAREPRADEVASWVEYLAAPFIEDQFLDTSEFAARWQKLVSSGS